VLRRIFGQKRDEMVRDWRKLINEELHKFCSSLNIIIFIKSRRMRWTSNVAHVEDFGGKGRRKEARRKN
jgi:hypothetical protein